MSTVATRPPAPANPALVDSEQYIDDHIRRTRRALKFADLAAGVITLAVGLLAFLLIAGLIDHWVVPGGLGPAGRFVMFGMLALGLGWFAWRQFVPLLRTINPVYAAHTIEKTAPSLKNSLLNVLLFRTHRQGMSARVFHALEQQAAQRLSSAPADASIDRTALLRLGYMLLAIFAVCAIYSVLSPKNLALSAGRVLAPWADLAPPTRVHILNIEPGETSVARGERVSVSAEIAGAHDDEPVRLRYSTLDESLVGETIAMTRPSAGVRFAADLPRATDVGHGAGGATGVQQDLEYWIEAGDAHSRRFRLTIFERPTIVVQRVRYEAPAYTGEPTKDVEHVGDLRGLEGTRVTLEALASQPIKAAYVDFDSDGRSDIKMQSQGTRAVASFVLELRPDRRTPWHINYVLRYTTTEGRTNSEPAQYTIDVTPDYAPEIRITQPEEPELAVRPGDIVQIGVEARDPDFALGRVQLKGRVGNQDVVLAELLSKDRSGLYKHLKPFVPADAKLKPGDVLEYWAEALDNRRPEPNVATSEHRRLRIVDPKAQGGQQPNNQGAGGEQPNAGDQNQQDGGENGQAGAENGGQQQPGAGQNDQSADGEQQPDGGAAGGGSGEQQQQGDGAGKGQPQGGGAGGASQKQNGAEGGDPQNAAGQSGAQNGGDASSNNSAEGAQQQPGDQSAEAGDSGNQSDAGQASGNRGAAGGNPQAGAQPERVSADGSNDGEAFDRMREVLGQQDATNGGANEPSPQGDQQNAEGATAGDQSTSANQQPAGANANPGNRDAAAEPGAGNQAEQNTGDPNANQSGQPTGEQSNPNGQQTNGANNEANAANNQTSPKGAGETPAGAEGPNQSNGASPAGDRNAGQAGAPNASPKNQNDQANAGEEDESQMGGEPGTADSHGNRESQARGDQSGDRAGAGQQGGGQQAENAGQGEPGSHEASDSGAGQSADQGPGETGTNAGEQQLADGETGQSSGDQPGAGSQSREATGQDSGKGTGEQQASSNGQQGAGDQSTEPQAGGPNGSEGEQPGENGAESQAADGQPANQPQAGGDQAGETGDARRPGEAAQNNQQQDGAAADGQQPGSQQPGGDANPSTSQAPSESTGSQSPSSGGSPTSPPQSGGTQGGGVDGSGPITEPGGDDPNLKFAREQTDLVLERLEDQLAKKKVDPEILKRLGWTEDELRQFVDRWKGLKAAADAAPPNDAEAKQRLNRALHALGLRERGPVRIRGAAPEDQLRDLNEGYRANAPLEYADRVRAYMRGAVSDDE